MLKTTLVFNSLAPQTNTEDRHNTEPPLECSQALGLVTGSDKHVMDSRADRLGLQLKMERVAIKDVTRCFRTCPPLLKNAKKLAYPRDVNIFNEDLFNL